MTRAIQAAFLMIGFLGFNLNIHAQQQPEYDWEPARTYDNNITDESSALLLLKNHIQYDYRYDNNDLIVYKTVHKIYRVNNDEALQSVNRIYIPMNSTIDIVKVKARTITKSGKIVELDKSNIKQIKDDEAGPGYSIFAIEGGEVGSDIEYFYTKKAQANLFVREFFQFGFPTVESSFALTSPENLKFDFKSYNGFGEVSEKLATNGLNSYEASQMDIELLTAEDFGSLTGNRMRIEFKLAYNNTAGKQRLFTWSDAGKRIFDIIYPFTDTELKAVKSLVKEQKLKNKTTELEKFLVIEHYIKTNFYLDEQAANNSTQLDNVIKNRFTTELGFARLFVALLNELNITHEIVMTSSRTEVPFDGSFDTWNNLGEYLIYLPDVDKFMSPYAFESRLGYIPPQFTATEGLFIKKMEFEGSTVPLGRVKSIPALPYQENFDNLDIKVTFTDGTDGNSISAKRTFRGFNANFVKLNYIFSNQEQKAELAKSLIEFLGPSAEIDKAEIPEPGIEFDEWTEPVTINGEFTSSEFIEKAGDIILFKAGELIGVQSELYQETKRKTPVENDYNRGYLRKISVSIPQGYNIQNPDDLIMNVDAKKDNKTVYLFKSGYTIEGQELTITIDEYYDSIYFPIERFEEFRKVINAAADWNKITLVLEPAQ